MSHSTKLALIILLSFGVVGGALAYGKHKFSDPATRISYMIQKASKKLDLNETQANALNTLKDEVIANKIKMEEDIKSLITAESFDQDKALAIINNKTSAINERAPTIIAALGNFLDTLDANQKAKIAKFMERRTHKHHHHHSMND